MAADASPRTAIASARPSDSMVHREASRAARRSWDGRRRSVRLAASPARARPRVASGTRPCRRDTARSGRRAPTRTRRAAPRAQRDRSTSPPVRSLPRTTHSCAVIARTAPRRGAVRAPPIGACSPPPRATARARSGLPLRRPRTQPTAPAPRARGGTRRATRRAKLLAPSSAHRHRSRQLDQAIPVPLDRRAVRPVGRARRGRPPRRGARGHTIGHGYRRPVVSTGNTGLATTAFARFLTASISSSSRSARNPGGTSRATRATSSTRSSGIGSPPNSQITVRSLASTAEAQAVVDGPDAPVEAEEAVPALAVGVVGQQVEGADRA